MKETEPIKQTLELIQTAFDDDRLVRITLSKSRQRSGELKNVFIRKVILKTGEQLNFVYRYQTKDEAKNIEPKQALAEIRRLMKEDMLILNLFTLDQDVLLSINKSDVAKLSKSKPSFSELPEKGHDKKKQHKTDKKDNYLLSLGITTSDGNIRKDKGDKYKQINKYLEIAEGLFREAGLLEKAEIVVTDMGAGKGYLTFALYDLLVNKLKKKVKMTGVDIKDKLVKDGNKRAKELGFKGLKFVDSTIAEFQLEENHALIALHACDTATDDAIFKGIRSNSELVIVAPCCHKQVRKDLDRKGSMGEMFPHGILQERQCEIITDNLRSMLMEEHGYKTKVFEFVSTEHTGKNIMITGVKKVGSSAAAFVPQAMADEDGSRERLKEIKEQFGLGRIYLEELLS